MMKLYQDYPLIQTVREAETFRTPKNIFLQILIFIGVFFILEIAESIGMIIGVLPRLMAWAREQASSGALDSEVMTEKLNSLLLDPELTYIMLLSTGLGTIVVLFFCRVIEGRKFRTMGLFKEKAGLQYLAGLGIGFAMFSCVVGLAYVFGGLQFESNSQKVTPILLVVLLGYGIQGMSEEVMCRGYMMTAIMRHHPVWLAVGINALCFGIMHGANAGFSLFALVNLILYAVMISLYTLRTNSLWGACAIHSIWNFAQGNFYGLPVSGIDSGESVFRMSLTGADWINGGDFGLEAGLPTTIVMTAGICILLFVPLPFLDKRSGGEQEA